MARQTEGRGEGGRCELCFHSRVKWKGRGNVFIPCETTNTYARLNTDRYKWLKQQSAYLAAAENAAISVWQKQYNISTAALMPCNFLSVITYYQM